VHVDLILQKMDHKVELIYHFAEDYWGYGYAAEVCKCAINYVKSFENCYESSL